MNDERPSLAIHERALHDLRFIRSAMERAGAFTAVSGRGGVAIGLIALAASPLAGLQSSPGRWLAVWLATAAVAAPVALMAMVRKARRGGEPLLSGPGRKFALAFSPPVLAAAVLTAVLWHGGASSLLPGLWLLLYGAAVVAAGSASVRVVPVMGGVFMVLGVLALVTPPAWGDAWMAAGFGLVHVGFGVYIARRHGG